MQPPGLPAPFDTPAEPAEPAPPAPPRPAEPPPPELPVGAAAADLVPPAAPTGPSPPTPAFLLRRAPAARPRDLAAMIAIIALADVALYGSAGGAGLALLFTGVPVILFVTATARTVTRRFAAIAALVALVAGRCLWQASAGATAVGMALLLPFAIALRTPRSFVPELLGSALGSALGSVRQLGGFGRALGRLTRPLWSTRASSAAFYVPAALVILFGAIFAAANPVLQGWIASAAALFDGVGWAPSAGRLVFWGAAAIAAAGLLRPVVQSIAWLDARLGHGHASQPTERAPEAAHLALVRNGLVALNALFLGYNALDAVYLWGGRAPSGVTHTEYAHAGTAWLTVAFVLSTIVLGAMFRGPIEHDPRGRLARGLAYAWAGQNFLLAAGTFRRITIYIAYSGLTELRVVGILGTTLATLGLAIVVAKLWRRRTMLWVMRRQLDALAVVIVAFVVTPVDALAMRYNVARIAADQYRPLLHLYEQPIRPEAIPALLPLLDHPDPVVRRGVAVIVAAQRDRLREAAAHATSWLDTEIARHRALDALADAGPRLAEVLPADREAAAAQLRGVAYGINDEVEREGDDAPFDWSTRRYAPRDY